MGKYFGECDSKIGGARKKKLFSFFAVSLIIVGLKFSFLSLEVPGYLCGRLFSLSSASLSSGLVPLI